MRKPLSEKGERLLGLAAAKANRYLEKDSRSEEFPH